MVMVTMGAWVWGLGAWEWCGYFGSFERFAAWLLGVRKSLEPSVAAKVNAPAAGGAGAANSGNDNNAADQPARKEAETAAAREAAADEEDEAGLWREWPTVMAQARACGAHDSPRYPASLRLRTVECMPDPRRSRASRGSRWACGR